MIHTHATTTRDVRIDETFRFRCARCAGVFGKPEGVGTGYGYGADEALTCYRCIGEMDARALADAKPGERFTHYLTRDKDGHYIIKNWPGTFKVSPYRVSLGHHNIGRTRTDAWFSYAGKAFHAVNIGDNQIARIRALKGAK